MLASILEMYGFKPDEWIIKPFGTGLINDTWLLKKDDEEYILQRINDNVFKDPFAISHNIRLVSDYLEQRFPNYFFVTPILSKNQTDLVQSGGYFRLFPFVKNSVTYTTVESPQLAYEAASQFGKFTHLLSNFNEKTLKETLPNFHNLGLRYSQYQEAIRSGNKKRVSIAADVIKQLEKYTYVVEEFEHIKRNDSFKKRVMHHDTKISNVLFDKYDKGLCIIDLDTVMPGFFISDVGDMMRTYLAAASEEETDFSKIDVREDYFVAVVEGYLSYMKASLTNEEQCNFIYAGKFMIYMQCIRFLGDYLINDVYYGAKYEGHNFNRAVNQLYLLESLESKQERLLQKIKRNKYTFLGGKIF